MLDFLVRYIWIVPFYGLLGAVLTLPWSMGLVQRTGPRPAAYFNLLTSAAAFIHGALAFTASWGGEPREIVVPWLHAADFKLTLAIRVSPVSLGALGLITGITLVTLIYALGYMEKDWSLARFFGMMGFFEAALSGIALSDSLLLSYGLLELLTLSTYLLVGFWYAQPLVVTAARDAFLTKRVGDIFLLMGLVALSSYGVGLTFSEIDTWAPRAELPPMFAALLGLALIAAPVAKCAQFPLNLWLDEAMEAPNPASLMRNSVVVTAGAYVLIQLRPIFALSPVVSDSLIAIGALTAVGASLVAIAQIDLKRTLSHSTSAYLGLVFVAVGAGQLDIALLLLLIHAIAKALLYMSAGSVILSSNNQNITEMGGLWSRMPATTSAFVVGSSGLVMLLPLGNFWVMGQWLHEFDSPLLLVLLLAVNGLSAVNLTRVFRLVFLGTPHPKTRRAPEAPWPMALPMVTLTFVALLAPLVPQRWQPWFQDTGSLATAGEVLARSDVLLLVLSGILGVALGAVVVLPRTWSRPVRASSRFIQDLLAYDFYIDRVYRATVVQLVGGFSRLADWLDRYIVDGLVNLVGLSAVLSGQGLKYSASGQLQFYLLTIFVGGALLFALLMNWQF
ncbi:NAD(P)H dehydrogenase, subunit NdhF3 family [Rubidibacter lacunae KORDI 51-2]|uniref:NAD(P)H dehydrogenase, subunit NdhF3 family n=1 Tax=Rubidibacter lacunae KORDI 51-2 TaxID=582515 RepID=U5DNZ1_9CHRO|nr:NAD(P)H-quinone oxidoreductase subunit F [Rubidibacter lacunae]ERN41425.1 NAD(P)H dehydrogenase, subunit NdhF3 family [Rubidibacter lacunae KORDI 51-2]